MRRWLAFLSCSALLAAGCSRDEVAGVDAALAGVQQEQAALAAAIEAAAAATLERKDLAVRRPVLKMGSDLERLRKVTGELRQVSVKELAAYREAIAQRKDARATLERMRHMDVAAALADHLVAEVRKDIAPAEDPTLRSLAQQYDGSLAHLGKAVASIRAILKVQRENLVRIRDEAIMR
jgi:hypothetical protein